MKRKKIDIQQVDEGKIATVERFRTSSWRAYIMGSHAVDPGKMKH